MAEQVGAKEVEMQDGRGARAAFVVLLLSQMGPMSWEKACDATNQRRAPSFAPRSSSVPWQGVQGRKKKVGYL